MNYGTAFPFAISAQRDVARCVIEPVAMIVRPMNSERTTQGIAELPRPEFVLAREDFNAVPQPRGALDGHPQPESNVIDVHPALLGQERLLAQDPKVTASP